MQRTLASLKREYEKEANKTLSDSSWYYRFTPELVVFLHQCVIYGIEELAKDPGRKLSKKLENFRDVFIQDSTIVRLHSSLAEKFPAARARTVAAGIKVGVMVSAVANGPKTVALYPKFDRSVYCIMSKRASCLCFLHTIQSFIPHLMIFLHFSVYQNVMCRYNVFCVRKYCIN